MEITYIIVTGRIIHHNKLKLGSYMQDYVKHICFQVPRTSGATALFPTCNKQVKYSSLE